MKKSPENRQRPHIDTVSKQEEEIFIMHENILYRYLNLFQKSERKNDGSIKVNVNF